MTKNKKTAALISAIFILLIFVAGCVVVIIKKGSQN